MLLLLSGAEHFVQAASQGQPPVSSGGCGNNARTVQCSNAESDRLQTSEAPGLLGRGCLLLPQYVEINVLRLTCTLSILEQ